MNRKHCTHALLGLVMVAAPSTAVATGIGLEPIPTMLVATDDPTGYPDPICSKCTIIVIEDEDSAGARAELHLAYPTDGPGFTGVITVNVALENAERHTAWIEDVGLEADDEALLVVEAGEGWSWSEVQFVWLTFVPG